MPARPLDAIIAGSCRGDVTNSAYHVQHVPTGRKKSQTMKTKTILPAVFTVLEVRARTPVMNSRVGKADGVFGLYSGSNRKGWLHNSHLVDPDCASQLTRQSSCVYLIEPEQRQGCLRGRLGSASPLHIRHSGSLSASVICAESSWCGEGH